MLIQLLIQHPQALGPILHNTPAWVWGLFTALLALGLSQVRTRSISALRMALIPVAMAGLSLWSTASAFGRSPLFVYVLLAWAVCAALMLGLMAPQSPPAGTLYDATSRRFHMPGSWVPLVLILGIFLTKYSVGIELSMQPTLAHEGQYTLIVGSLYGLFSGIFAGRAARLWRLAGRPGGRPAATAFNT